MILASLLVQFFSLGMPIFYMVIFDRVFGRQNLATLDVIAIGMVLILLFDLMIKELRSFILSRLLEYVDRAGFESVLNRAFNIPLSKATQDLRKAFSDRFSEVLKINHAVTSTLMVSSLDVAFSVIVVIFLFLLNK